MRIIIFAQIEQGNAFAHPRFQIVWVESQRLVERAKGGLRVAGLGDTFVSHQVIFVGIALLDFAHRVEFALEGFDSLFLPVYDLKFQTEEALDGRIPQLIPFADGLGKSLDRFVETTPLEAMGGAGVEQFGLAVLQRLLDKTAVVELLTEGDDFLSDKDVGGDDAVFQHQSLERSAAAEGDVCLSTGKDSSGQIDDDAAEREALTLMHRDGPGKTDGQLLEGTDDFLLDAFLLFVVTVFVIVPNGWFDEVFLAVLQQDIDVALVVDAGNHADGAVYPTLLPVVLDKDDLRLFFDG